MKRPGLFLFAILFVASFSPSSAGAVCREIEMARGLIARAHAAEADATIEYFGHNFFQITTRKGTRIVTDPLGPGMHPTPYVAPHAITVGREHPNHNYVELAHGNPIILRGLAHHGAEWNPISTTVRDVFIYNVPIYQHGIEGALKGAAFMFDLGALCIAHLGDLAHTLNEAQLKQIGKVDIALIPIGGVFTMSARVAREVLQQIRPKIAIPMHYRDNPFILAPFIKGIPARQPDSNSLTVSKSALPATTEIVVLRSHGRADYR
jgi:L-ascorbate metabolism protein UlaG (beta-lactamase superfamily)